MTLGGHTTDMKNKNFHSVFISELVLFYPYLQLTVTLWDDFNRKLKYIDIKPFTLRRSTNIFALTENGRKKEACPETHLTM